MKRYLDRIASWVKGSLIFVVSKSSYLLFGELLVDAGSLGVGSFSVVLVRALVSFVFLEFHLGHKLVLACSVVHKALSLLLLVVSVLVGGQLLVVMHVDLVGLNRQLHAPVSVAVCAHMSRVLGVVVDRVINPVFHARAMHTSTTSLFGELVVAHDHELVLDLVVFSVPERHGRVHRSVFRVDVVHALVVGVGKSLGILGHHVGCCGEIRLRSRRLASYPEVGIGVGKPTGLLEPLS